MNALIKSLMYWLILCLTGLSLAASADPLAVAELVQHEAWLERNGARTALETGTALQSGDRLTTGENARVVLRLHDQSVIKLGARARVNVDRLVPPARPGDGAQGALQVLSGAFRYTAEQAAPARNLEVKVGDSLTMGIRGTDVWGKSADDKDLVCLLEGKVEVRAGDTQAILDQPRHFFVVPKGQPALPVGFQSPEKIVEWAVQTEPYPDEK